MKYYTNKPISQLELKLLSDKANKSISEYDQCKVCKTQCISFNVKGQINDPCKACNCYFCDNDGCKKI
jgi:hypothetical protein